MPELKVICLSEVRKNYDRCRHMHVVVDVDLAEVECDDCGERLNPVATLLRFAHEENRLKHRIDELNKINKRLSKRVRTKCQHCGRMTRVNDR